MSPSRSPVEELRAVDRELLGALRDGEAKTIGQLTEQLGVTATAIRQRVDRLLEMGLIDREKIVAGRGRPTFRYQLTVDGHRHAGANPVDLADALWREILAIEDDSLREQVLSSVAARLGRQYAAEVDREGDRDEEDSFETRMQKLSEMMSARRIATEVSHSGHLPVLDIGVCPYPSLTDASDDRAMCRLEEEMISEALGKRVHLSSCRLDGDACCQFSAVESDADDSG